MSETQRLIWLLSMPACADVDDAMQNLTGGKYHTSEQHKDTTHARQDCDYKDTIELVTYLAQRNPFSLDPSLHSITTGAVASEDVNAEKARGRRDFELNGWKEASRCTCSCCFRNLFSLL